MNFEKTMRCILYHWVIFLVSFVLVFGASFVAFYQVTKERPVIQEGDRVSVSTVFENNKKGLTEEQAVVYQKVAEVYFLEKGIRENNPKLTTTAYPVGTGIQLVISGESIEEARDLNKTFSADFVKDFSGLGYRISYQTTDPIAIQRQAAIDIPTVPKFELLIMSGMLGLVCAMSVIFAWENLDPRIRSVGKLRGKTSFAMLSPLPQAYTEVELLVWGKAVVAEAEQQSLLLCSLKQEVTTAALAVALARQVANVECRVLVVDFTQTLAEHSSDAQVQTLRMPSDLNAGYFSGQVFAEQMNGWKAQNGLVLLVAPPMHSAAMSIALAQQLPTVVLASFSKDFNRDVEAVPKLLAEQSTIKGISIVDYKPQVDFIYGG